MLLKSVKRSMKGPEKFCLIKNSCQVINKLISRGFRASSLSTFDFSTLNTTLPNNLIKDNLKDFIERGFQRGGSFFIAWIYRHAFSPLLQLEIIIYGLVKKCVKFSPFF